MLRKSLPGASSDAGNAPKNPKRLGALLVRALVRLLGLGGLGLAAFGALFFPKAALAWLLLVVLVGLLAKKGGRLHRAAWACALTGPLFGASPYFLSRDLGCPRDSAHLRWLDRTGATYDALVTDDNTLVMGRRFFYGQSGLLARRETRFFPLAKATAVQSLLNVGEGRLLAADWGAHQLLSLEAGHVWRLPLCRWPIELQPFGDKVLALCEGDRKIAQLGGWPPRIERLWGLSERMKAPYSLAVMPSTDEVVVSNWNPPGGLEAIHLRTGKRRFVPTDGPVMGLLFLAEKNELLAAMPLQKRIARLSAVSLRPVDFLRTSLGTRRLAATGGAIGAVNYFEGTFQAWDRTTFRPLFKQAVGKLARGVQPFGDDGFLVSTGCGVGEISGLY